MKRLVTNVRNSGAREVDLDPEAYKQFKDNMFTALKKFGSSRKTRAVHKLIDQDMISPVVMDGATSDLLGAFLVKGPVLGKIMLNVYLFDDSLDTNGAVHHATKMHDIEADIRKEKTYIKEEQIKNLEILKERKQEATKKFLNSLDYLKIIDGIYFEWLFVLSSFIVEKQSNLKSKVVTTAADTLAAALKKIYLKASKKLEPETHQLLEAIAIYFIYIYFYGESATYTLNLMKKAFKEDTLEPIKMSKVTQFKEFEDLGLLLKETDLMPMTVSTFKLQMESIFGKYGYQNYLTPSLSSFLAFLANLTYPTQLFKDSYAVNDENHKRLEELILNAQKGFTFKNVSL